MEYTHNEKLDIEIPRISFGAWAIGGSWWGDVDDNDSIRAIDAAFEHGVRLFDTAPIYGDGHSEEIVGKALVGKREKVLIATKWGLKKEGKRISIDNSIKRLRFEIEESLNRLKTHYIDIYQIHWPEANFPYEEAIFEMQKLRDEGKIRFIGVSNFDVMQMERCKKAYDIDFLQPPYNLLNRKIEKDILPYCHEKNISTLIYGPLAQGLLTGKFNKDDTFTDVRKMNELFKGYLYLKNLEIVEKLKPIADKYSVSIGNIATRWLMEQKGVTSLLMGAKTDKQVIENLNVIGLEIETEDLNYVNSLTLDRV